MFADSLLDSNWDNRSHRGWTTLASFAMQALAVGILLTLPLIYSEGLPKLRVTTIDAPVGPPPGRHAEGMRHASASARPNTRSTEITAPPSIPTTIDHSADPIPVPDVDACPTCVPGGTGDLAGDKNSIVGALAMTGVQPPIPAFKPTVPQRRVSTIMEGNLVYKPQPAYPPSARSMRIQGPVVLRAIISKSGAIENLQVLSGHPLLVKAAIEAVSQWRYRPYVLNGEPVEVETRMIVNFTLSGG
jgi:protein TonB